jgi:hypothetical protein
VRYKFIEKIYSLCIRNLNEDSLLEITELIIKFEDSSDLNLVDKRCALVNNVLYSKKLAQNQGIGFDLDVFEDLLTVI